MTVAYTEDQQAKKAQAEEQQPAEGEAGLWWVRAGSDAVRGWNNIRYKTGLSGKNTPAQALSMNVATVPPGGIAYAHIHSGFEVMLFILEGHVRHEYGETLEHSVDHYAGDFIFIEPGVPHEVFNASDTDPVVAVVARSAADEWDRIVDVPSRHRDAALNSKHNMESAAESATE